MWHPGPSASPVEKKAYIFEFADKSEKLVSTGVLNRTYADHYFLQDFTNKVGNNICRTAEIHIEDIITTRDKALALNADDTEMKKVRKALKTLEFNYRHCRHTSTVIPVKVKTFTSFACSRSSGGWLVRFASGVRIVFFFLLRVIPSFCLSSSSSRLSFPFSIRSSEGASVDSHSWEGVLSSSDRSSIWDCRELGLSLAAGLPGRKLSNHQYLESSFLIFIDNHLNFYCPYYCFVVLLSRMLERVRSEYHIISSYWIRLSDRITMLETRSILGLGEIRWSTI